MNEFAKILLSVRKSPLKYRIVGKIKHWLWKFKTRKKPDAF